jgi:hypothetical protein
MSAQTAALEAATIGQQCKVLHCRRSRRSARNSPNRHCANGAHIWASSKRCSRPNSRNANSDWWSGASAKRVCRG